MLHFLPRYCKQCSECYIFYIRKMENGKNNDMKKIIVSKKGFRKKRKEDTRD